MDQIVKHHSACRASGQETDVKPLIVGIGGTTQPGSTTENALLVALKAAEAHGAVVKIFDGPFLTSLPYCLTEASNRSVEVQDFVAAIRAADGVIIASPGYHGTISGLVKNAIDYIEHTAKDSRVYLDGVPVGLIATAYGWQATGSTLVTLRSIVHALRGWPTPLGAAIKSENGLFANGECTDAGMDMQLGLVGQQVVDFARLRRSRPHNHAGTAPNQDLGTA
jgi:FMN reductase